MSKLSDYQELLCDGARLELCGEKESAKTIYRAVVKKCATLDSANIDALSELYGDSAYDSLDTYKRAIESATIALCCSSLMELVLFKFSNSDCIAREDAEAADLTVFFRWLYEDRTPNSTDYEVLKRTQDELQRCAKVLLPKNVKSAWSLQELIRGYVMKRYRL